MRIKHLIAGLLLSLPAVSAQNLTNNSTFEFLIILIITIAGFVAIKKLFDLLAT